MQPTCGWCIGWRANSGGGRHREWSHAAPGGAAPRRIGGSAAVQPPPPPHGTPPRCVRCSAQAAAARIKRCNRLTMPEPVLCASESSLVYTMRLHAISSMDLLITLTQVRRWHDPVVKWIHTVKTHGGLGVVVASTMSLTWYWLLPRQRAAGAAFINAQPSNIRIFTCHTRRGL